MNKSWNIHDFMIFGKGHDAWSVVTMVEDSLGLRISGRKMCV